MDSKIVRNRIRCKKCDTILESKHRHDFVSCDCGTFTDGGTEYLRRGWAGGEYEDAIEELDEYAVV